MIPAIPELEKLEALASAETPTAVGAWWITCQIAEHLFHSMGARDKVSYQFLPDYLIRLLEECSRSVGEAGARPVPNDSLQQLLRYVEKPAAHIIRSPRTNLIKVESGVRPHELSEMRTKTMNWLAKQPGRTMREKLAGKKKVVAMVNDYTCNTKENRVAMQVLRKLEKLVRDRLDNGVGRGAYDEGPSDQVRVQEMRMFLSLVRKAKDGPLAEVQVKDESVPNNVLMGDKDYSVIWRAGQILKSYERHITGNWDNVFRRYVQALYWSVVGELAIAAQARVIDNLATVFDSDGEIGIRSFGVESAVGKRQTRMITGLAATGYKQAVVRLINTKKQLAFLEYDNRKYACFPGSMHRKEDFDALRVHRTVFFLPGKTNSGGDAAQDVRLEDEWCGITVTLEDTVIGVELQKLVPEGGAEYYATGTLSLRFHLVMDPETVLASGRGIPLRILKSVDWEEPSGWQDGPLYADMETLRFLTRRIAEDVMFETWYPIYNKAADQVGVGTAGEAGAEELCPDGAAFDFTCHSPLLMAGGKPMELKDKQLYSIAFEPEGSHGSLTVRYEPPLKTGLYDLASEVVPLNGMLDGQELNGPVRSAFISMLERLRQELDMPKQGIFSYTVPDSVDEFSQRGLKTLMKASFESAYPVWRSVAAAMYWKNKEATPVKAGWSILVLDTHVTSGHAVLLKAKYDDSIRDIVYEHYVPYSTPDEEFEIHTGSVERSYLDAFGAKYGIDLPEELQAHLLRSGKVHRVLAGKDESVEITEAGGFIRVFKLFYDIDCYCSVYERWLKHLTSCVNSVKTEAQGAKFQGVLVLGDHLANAPSTWKQTLAELFPESHAVELVTTPDMLGGALEINRRLALKQPTWYEFLPDLSLEVVKDGHYDELELIKNESISVMGEERIIEVQERLILEQGHGSYRFPLIKSTAGKHNREIIVRIKHPSFPLPENFPVRLSIRYRYGYENSYELMVSPLETRGAPFDTLVAELLQEDQGAVRNNPYPSFPSADYSDEGVKRLISQLGEHSGKVERFFEGKVMRGIPVTDDNLRYMENELFRSIRPIQQLALSGHPDAESCMDEIYEGKLMEHLTALLSSQGHLPESFFEQVSQGALDKFRSTVLQFLCSFGPYMSKSLYTYIIQHKSLPYKTRYFGRMLLGNSDHEELLDTVAGEYRQDPRGMIRSLRLSIWDDGSVVRNLYRRRPEFVEDMVKYIAASLRKTYEARSSGKRPSGSLKGYEYLFRDYCEILLAVLRLRGEERFPGFLHTGTPFTANLAKHIRRIDAELYVQNLANHKAKSRVIFTLKDKPEALKNMSNIAYVLNKYLTGDEGTNLIQVSGIEEDSES